MQNGCEVDIKADVNNCGNCGASCALVPNATEACVGGACAIGSCNSGYADCNGQYNDGCETNWNICALSDAFNWTGNTRMTVAAANGVLANDPANTVISAADTATTLGGVVNVNTATGAFTYDPPLGAQNQADTFTYTAGGAPVTVTINLAERIWYVRNNDAGANQGNDQAPFLTLAQAGAASDVNDTIFVFAGNGTATGQNNGITLLSGQKLIGEGIGLSVNANQIVNAGANASISNAGLAVG
ncbi:MAG: hypothetical protein HZA16_14240, partial [Nitrospirae bacterium]|nr:hypothetical protein [Nitrospirota bacterium]